MDQDVKLVHYLHGIVDKPSERQSFAESALRCQSHERSNVRVRRAPVAINAKLDVKSSVDAGRCFNEERVLLPPRREASHHAYDEAAVSWRRADAKSRQIDPILDDPQLRRGDP